MRNILVTVPLLFLLTFCSMSKYQQPSMVVTYGYDFNEFVKEGFIFTPLEYKGKADIVGIISIEIKPQIIAKMPNLHVDKEKYVITNNYLVEKTNARDALRSAKEEAKKMGADGIMLLQITHPDNKYPDALDPKFDAAVNTNTYIISGYAFKRK